MAVGTATVLAGAALVSAGVGVKGAIDAKKSAKTKEGRIKAETNEALRLKENEIQDFEAAQTTAFAKSGVLLEGTPLDVLEATRQEGERQKQGIVATGKAQGSLAKAQGRAAVLGGIGSVASGVAGVAGAFK